MSHSRKSPGYRLLGTQRLAGALTLGEIGSTNAWGYPMFHNACLVGLTWGRHES